MFEKPKIFVLCGMIASGKSTYCKHAAKNGAIIVNDDAIVNAVHADDYLLYNKRLKFLYKTIENNIVSTALSLGCSAVVDRAVNLKIESRKRWLGLAHCYDVEIEAIVFPFEKAEIHAARRFQADSRGLSLEEWREIAEVHLRQLDMPSLQEGFDAVRHTNFEEITNGTVFF